MHKHKGLEVIGKTGGVNVKDIAALADRMLAIIEGRKTMKKTMKKTLSAAWAAALSLSAFAGITVNAQDSYEDYVPGEKAANLIPDASDRCGYTYFGENHLQIGTVFWETDSEIGGYYVKYSYTGTGNMSLKSIGDNGEQWRENGGGGGGGTPVSPAEIENTPSTAPAEPGQTEQNFSDVDSSHWAFDEIYHLKKLGVISGVDEEHFVPEGQVTREQFIKMFIDAFGYQKTNSELSFSDVSQDAWYAEISVPLQRKKRH